MKMVMVEQPNNMSKIDWRILWEMSMRPRFLWLFLFSLPMVMMGYFLLFLRGDGYWRCHLGRIRILAATHDCGAMCSHKGIQDFCGAFVWGFEFRSWMILLVCSCARIGASPQLHVHLQAFLVIEESKLMLFIIQQDIFNFILDSFIHIIHNKRKAKIIDKN
jgi:hypothetical protein